MWVSAGDRHRKILLFLLLIAWSTLPADALSPRRSRVQAARRGTAAVLAAAAGASLLVHSGMQGVLQHEADSSSNSGQHLIRAASHRSALEVVQDSSLVAEMAPATEGKNRMGTRAAAASRSRSHRSFASSNGTASSLPTLFLFIGILSGQGLEERRAAVREAWANDAQRPGEVVAKFVLSEYERTAAVQAELERYDDIIFVPQRTDYSTILHKTYHILEHAVQHYDAAFILKTDDDAFVNVPALAAELRWQCTQPGCRGERLYMGSELRGAEVVTEAWHRWNNEAFANHTGLGIYPAYMTGGGYVVSADVAATLVDTHRHHIPLKHTTAEDVTLALWLLPLDLRWVDHPRFRTRAEPCCVAVYDRKRLVRFSTSQQQQPPEPAQLALEGNLELPEDIEQHICGPDPWLVLHKLHPPSHTRYVGNRVRRCSSGSASTSRAPPLLSSGAAPTTAPHWAARKK